MLFEMDTARLLAASLRQGLESLLETGAEVWVVTKDISPLTVAHAIPTPSENRRFRLATTTLFSSEHDALMQPVFVSWQRASVYHDTEWVNCERLAVVQITPDNLTAVAMRLTTTLLGLR